MSDVYQTIFLPFKSNDNFHTFYINEKVTKKKNG